MKTVEFMVEYKDEYIGTLPYEIVENEPDYDIYRVKTDDISKIIVVMGDKEYKPDRLTKFNGGYYVSVWRPIE